MMCTESCCLENFTFEWRSIKTLFIFNRQQTWSRLRNRDRKPSRFDSRSSRFRFEPIRVETSKSESVHRRLHNVRHEVHRHANALQCQADSSVNAIKLIFLRQSCSGRSTVSAWQPFSTRGQCCKTFWPQSKNFCNKLECLSLQAFPVLNSVCDYGQEPTLEWSTLRPR